MNDLISRQAVIDALGGNEPVGDPSKMDDDDVVKMWERIRIINIINKLPSAQPETHDKRTETHACDLISRQAAIDAVMEFMPSLTTPDGCGPFDREIFEAQEMFVDIGQALNELPTAQPEQQNARIFQGIIVEYPSISTYPEYEGKPYFSIKYTENGQDFIGYGTYKPDVLSEYLKKYFIPSAQPDSKELSFTHKALDTISRQAVLEWLKNEWNGRIATLFDGIKGLPSAQPETHDKRTETHACDCISRQAAMEEISKQQTYKMFEGEDTLYFDANDVGSVIASLPSAHPELEEAYICGETEAEARYHAQQRWIPCSERLPLAEYGESDNVLATCGHRDGEDTSIRWINTLYFNGGCWCYPTGEIYDQKVYAWMPLPEPYAERRTDERQT